ncbi:MAG TPA: hypothetical protein PKL29_00915 [Methanothrix sp.]|nr:hypothetical protein [Methanothrix sp.]
MRMQKEEKIVVILLLMALGSLAVAFWAFAPDENNDSSDRTDSDGSFGADTQRDGTQSVEGQILEMKPTKSGGNLLLTLDSTALDVFIPASAGAEKLKEQLQVGDRIRAAGTVTEYMGDEELSVSKRSDIQLIDSGSKQSR